MMASLGRNLARLGYCVIIPNIVAFGDEKVGAEPNVESTRDRKKRKKPASRIRESVEEFRVVLRWAFENGRYVLKISDNRRKPAQPLMLVTMAVIQTRYMWPGMGTPLHPNSCFSSCLILVSPVNLPQLRCSSRPPSHHTKSGRCLSRLYSTILRNSPTPLTQHPHDSVHERKLEGHHI